MARRSRTLDSLGSIFSIEHKQYHSKWIEPIGTDGRIVVSAFNDSNCHVLLLGYVFVRRLSILRKWEINKIVRSYRPERSYSFCNFLCVFTICTIIHPFLSLPCPEVRSVPSLRHSGGGVNARHCYKYFCTKASSLERLFLRGASCGTKEILGIRVINISSFHVLN